ncbi:UNVERIFIED_ORG: hypothetical protein Xoosp15_156 [Xanthomonas phage Xoo-sp15]
MTELNCNEMVNATLINYFDVWGNEEDGWEINNLCKEGEIQLSNNAKHIDMLNAIIEFGFFSELASLETLEIYDGGEMVEFYEKSNNKPICRLEIKWR